MFSLIAIQRRHVSLVATKNSKRNTRFLSSRFKQRIHVFSRRDSTKTHVSLVATQKNNSLVATNKNTNVSSRRDKTLFFVATRKNTLFSRRDTKKHMFLSSRLNKNTLFSRRDTQNTHFSIVATKKN